MTDITSNKYTPQQEENYGEGKKVTSTLLHRDAENSAYLLMKLQDTRKHTIQTRKKTHTPTQIKTQTNINTTDMTTQTLPDGTKIQAQIIHEISTGETSASLTTPLITLPDGKSWTKITNPVHTPTGTSCTKKILGNTTVINYTFKELDIEELTGDENGEIQNGSLVQQYLETRNCSQLPDLSTVGKFKIWLSNTNETCGGKSFLGWLNREKHIIILDRYDNVSFLNNTVYTPYKIHTATVIRNNSPMVGVTIRDEAFDISSEVFSNISEGLQIQLHYNPLYEEYTEDILEVRGTKRFNYILADEYIPKNVDPESITVLKNEEEQVRGIHYTITTDGQGRKSLHFNDAEENDIIEIIYTKDWSEEDIRVLYDLTREDTSSNVIVLYSVYEYM